MPTVASRYYDDLVAQLPSLEGRLCGDRDDVRDDQVAAVTFAQAGAQVLMLNRRLRADAIQARLEERFGAGSVRTLTCDLKASPRSERPPRWCVMCALKPACMRW